jgi:hypothetical protein
MLSSFSGYSTSGSKAVSAMWLGQPTQPQQVVHVRRARPRLDQAGVGEALEVVDDGARRQLEPRGEVGDGHPPAVGEQADDAQPRGIGECLER